VFLDRPTEMPALMGTASSPRQVAVVCPLIQTSLNDSDSDSGNDISTSSPLADSLSSFDRSSSTCALSEDDIVDTSAADDELSSTTSTRYIDTSSDAYRQTRCYTSASPATSPNEWKTELRSLPYYHGSIGSDDARRLLSGCSVGTFLVRDSQHERFDLAISVVLGEDGHSRRRDTCKMPVDVSRQQHLNNNKVTSVRVKKNPQTGHFHLDTTAAYWSRMPTFRRVRELVDFLSMSSDRLRQRHVTGCVVVDHRGDVEQRLRLRQPLNRTL